MKKRTKICIFNMATIIFALLTVVSLSAWGTLPVYNIVVNTSLFAALTYICAEKETALRKSVRKKNPKMKLEVYSQKSVHPAA